MQPVLAYDQAPPFTLPARFFLAMPVWLACSGLVCLAWGSQAEAGRFSPVVLALTHLLALGVLGNVMAGAVLQILAVVAGAGYRHPGRLGLAVFWPLQLGVGALAGAFLTGFSALLFRLALACLVWGLGLLALVLTRGLLNSPARDATSRALAFAAVGLLCTVLFGGTMAAVFGWALPLPMTGLLELHMLAAALGWLLMLVAGVAVTVVPMFMLTPAYPASFMRVFSPALVLAALLGALAVAAGWPRLAALPAIGAAAGFALLTLGRLQASRRPADPARRFWLTGMLALLLAQLALAVGLCLAEAAPLWALATGWLWLAGFGCAAAFGMLYKITPFLAWLHLKALHPPRGALPSMHGFIDASAQARGWQVYLFWLASGLLWCARPATAPLLGMATLALAGVLGHAHGRALWRYYRLRQAFLAAPDCPPS